MGASAGSIRLRVLFSGSVQGVGFRYRTAQVAPGHAVVGYVQNLPDGRVELVVEGQLPVLQGFVNAVRAEMGRHIRDAQQVEEAATGEFGGFSIRH